MIRTNASSLTFSSAGGVTRHISTAVGHLEACFRPTTWIKLIDINAFIKFSEVSMLLSLLLRDQSFICMLYKVDQGISQLAQGQDVLAKRLQCVE